MNMLAFAPPRFLLLLVVEANLVRAALATRDLIIASSAKQTFTVNADACDPAEIWYKMKKVIAACFDIGRTQPRELAACAIVGDDKTWCVWQDRAGDVDAVGYVGADASLRRNALALLPRFREHAAPLYGGSARAWLLWNLSGAYVVSAAEWTAWRARAAECDAPLTEPRICAAEDENCLGVIRARSPFAEPLPVAASFSFAALQVDDAAPPEEIMARAAARVDKKFFPAPG